MLHLLSCQLTVANEDELLLLEFGIWDYILSVYAVLLYDRGFFKGDI